ncbi:MAG: BMP family ABC transporter substrate-binding protein [Thermoleophilia bacterium]
MKKRLLKYTAMAIVVAAVIALTGCGSDDSSSTTAASSAASIEKIAIAAPEKGNDYGWNQQGVEGATAAAESAGAEIDVADGSGYDDVEPVLRRLAQRGAKLIIAQASGYNTVAPKVAAEFKVPTIVFDSPSATTPGEVADVETSSQQGAYLAGILAAKTTKTGTLGIVISAADTNWFKQAGGFAAGAKSVNPDVKFKMAQIGQAAYADSAGGKRVTSQVIAAGADVVFGMGDGASFGMLQAVETAKAPAGADKVWFIDVIGDKTPIDKKGVLLSSVIWDFTKVYEQAIADIGAGTFGDQGYDLSVSNGISLLRTDHASDEVWAEIDDAQAKIASGEIDVPLTPDQAAVNALIK